MSLPDVDFVDESPPTAPPSPTDTEPQEPGKKARPTTGICTECGTSFDIGPRGRVPKKCPVHRQTKTADTGTRRRRTRHSAGEYADMAYEVITGYVTTPLLIVGLGFPHPGPIATGFAVQYQTAPRAVNEKGEIVQHGMLAEALGEIAEQETKIADVLVQLTKATPYVKLATAIMPIIPQVAVNFGLLKPGVLGTADPNEIQETLRSQVVAQMADQFVPFSDVVAQMGTEPNGNGVG